MATMSADQPALVVVDTNILLAATDRSRVRHAAALRFLESDVRALAITPQIAREYLAVATRPLGMNGLGMTPDDAVANLRQFLAAMQVLTEGSGTLTHLLDLVVDGPALGRQVHDANVVAVALAHEATAIVTDNVRHFARFAALIAIEELG